MATEAVNLIINDGGQQIGVTVGESNQPVRMSVAPDSQGQTVDMRIAEESPQRVSLTIADNQQVVNLATEEVRVVPSDGSLYPVYDGATSVTPMTTAQTLQTRQTLVMDNISVQAIPYYETTNVSGGYTAIIGG